MAAVHREKSVSATCVNRKYIQVQVHVHALTNNNVNIYMSIKCRHTVTVITLSVITVSSCTPITIKTTVVN